MSANIELLELIAELNMSEDKSRKALGSEIKRLTQAQSAELAAKNAEIERLQSLVDGFKEDFVKLQEFKETMPRPYRHQYFFEGGGNMVGGYIRLLNFLIGYTSDDMAGLEVIFGITKDDDQ